MNRRLKSTILAVLVLAVGSAGAGPAQAAPLFEADSYAANVDGSALTEAIFGFHPGASPYKWECVKVPIQGKLTSSSSALTLTPTYQECRWQYPVTEPPQPFSAVTMTMNGCDWRLHTLSKLKAGEYKSFADLECPFSKEVVIDLRMGGTIICRMRAKAQTSKSQINLIDQANKEGSADDSIEAKIAVGGLSYKLEAFLGCPVGSGTYEDLTYSGIQTLTATSEAGKQIGLRVTGE